ncbi:LysE family translocator [Fulvivirga sp. RKSG066]|uniref:LysE family translocator n=1 Tax=Fulvivirga aurantia TaxID=2529383 RepID=UPI0012BBE195|nr:LysE family translocator [Fulvivirga aurantia]MTI21847.1 LysE family translocator [Fulvivirga aurantia]
MEVNLIAFFSFIVITSFTPGPNNIASASFGVLIGYRQTLKFLLGIVAGFFMMLWVCALLSNALLTSAPFLSEYLKYIGAAYILWLAYQTLKAGYSSSQDAKQLASFTRGFLLQLVNPKGLFYGLTIFTTFLVSTGENFFQILPWTLLLILVCFCAISTWTLFGTLIQRYMRNERLKKIINTVLALALVFTAFQIAFG